MDSSPPQPGQPIEKMGRGYVVMQWLLEDRFPTASLLFRLLAVEPYFQRVIRKSGWKVGPDSPWGKLSPIQESRLSSTNCGAVNT